MFQRGVSLAFEHPFDIDSLSRQGAGRIHSEGLEVPNVSGST